MYLEQISQLPILPQPEAFGLHENADITKDLQETEAMVATLLMTGGASGGGDSGSKEEGLVGAMVQDILARMPPAFDVEKTQYKYPVRYDQSMNQVRARITLRRCIGYFM